jgi:hypothetical protein
MLNKPFQQEILLSYNSSFLSMIYVDKCDSETSCIYIDVEKIEEAFWNGLLNEILPEICKMTHSGRQMFIWKIRDYDATMEIDIGEYPAGKDFYFCIDPYKFMASRPYESNS